LATIEPDDRPSIFKDFTPKNWRSVLGTRPVFQLSFRTVCISLLALACDGSEPLPTRLSARSGLGSGGVATPAATQTPPNNWRGIIPASDNPRQAIAIALGSLGVTTIWGWMAFGNIKKAPLTSKYSPLKFVNGGDISRRNGPPEASPDLGQILTAIADLAVMIDVRDGRILGIPGRPAEAIAGPLRDRIGDSIAAIFPPEQVEEFRRHVRQTLTTGETSRRQYSLAVAGKKCWFEAALSPLMAHTVLWVGRDITEQKRREKMLRAIARGTAISTGDKFFAAGVRHLAEALDVSHVLIAEWAGGGRRRVRTLAVWEGGRPGDHFEYDIADTPCRKVLAGETYLDSETAGDRHPRDPKLKRWKIRGYWGMPLLDEAGRTLGHLAVMDTRPIRPDETAASVLNIFAARAAAELERRGAEKGLSSEVEMNCLLNIIARDFIDHPADDATQFALRTLAEFTDSDRGYWVTYSADQTEFYMTHYWCSSGAAPPPEPARKGTLSPGAWPHDGLLRGQTVEISDAETLPAPARRELGQFLSGSVRAVVLVPTFHHNRIVGFMGFDIARAPKRWSLGEMSLLRQVGNTIALGQARGEAENALRQAKEAAEVANRSKGEFLARMTHDLRTPLNVILGFAELLLDDAALQPPQRDNLKRIYRSGQYLLELIDNVLEMSRLESGRTPINTSRFDLFELLDSLRQMLQLSAESKGLELAFEIGGDVPRYVTGDRAKLHQVLINLLENGIKFATSGRVTLRVGREPPDFLRFEVEDTGPGIDPEELDRLFEPFVQTAAGRQSQRGTGLGLCISSKFVQMMGGKIQVRSRPGAGSVFGFTLPAGSGSPEPAAFGDPQRRGRIVGLVPTGGRSHRILVVDDRPENRQLLLRFLGPAGFDVREAQNGMEAVAAWEDWRPELILMDLRMPVMDGYEATRQIRAAAGTPDSPVILAVTAGASESERSIIELAGCNGILLKPIRQHSLLENLGQYLGVQYFRAGSTTKVPGSNSSSQFADFNALQSQLRSLSPTWVAQLYDAAGCVDDDRIFELIAAVPEGCGTLAAAIEDWVRNFRCDRIIDLIEHIPDAESQYPRR